MKFRISVVFIFISLAISTYGQNNSVYNQIWISGAYQKNFSLRTTENSLNIRIDGSYRSIEGFKYTRQFVLRGIATYIHHDNWYVGIGPCLSWQYPYYQVKPVFEFRPTAQISYSIALARGQLWPRLRWEFRMYDNGNGFDPLVNRARFQLRYRLPINEKIVFTMNDEIMFQNNHSACFHFQTNRIYAGFIFKVKKLLIETGFMLQSINKLNSNWETDNNFMLNLSN
jgi:hypothetical protein